MIKLVDLLELAGLELSNVKIHCATSDRHPPLDAFFAGQFKKWQEHQSQKNFECDKVVSLIHLWESKWLFAGVFSVEDVKENKKGKKVWYEYKTKEVSGLDHLIGKVIIHFEKKFRASYLRDTKFLNELVVDSIRNTRMTIGDFPGYNRVLLSIHNLKTIISESNPSWRGALSNMAGVYLVVDKKTGKQYVGSAYGDEGIWHRWTTYASNGHGGNKELKELLKENKISYSENFQFSILEVCDIRSSDDYVIERETYWKSVLLSREFGLNKN